MSKCTGRNGSYACQYDSEEPHKGMHYAYYITGGRAFIASWVDHYSKVTTHKAPIPKFRPFTRDLEE